jgi:hypothetical protein
VAKWYQNKNFGGRLKIMKEICPDLGKVREGW